MFLVRVLSWLHICWWSIVTIACLLSEYYHDCLFVFRILSILPIYCPNISMPVCYPHISAITHFWLTYSHNCIFVTPHIVTFAQFLHHTAAILCLYCKCCCLHIVTIDCSLPAYCIQFPIWGPCIVRIAIYRLWIFNSLFFRAPCYYNLVPGRPATIKAHSYYPHVWPWHTVVHH